MTRVIEIPYTPREHQRRWHNVDKKRMVIVCHRRGGKTTFAKAHLVRAALTNPLPMGRYAYIAPERQQAKDILWESLKDFTRAIPGVKFNESELYVEFPNKARITLRGASKPDQLRGTYLDGVVIDEVAQMPSELFSEIISPQLMDRRGFAIFIGTPKGKNYFYNLYMQAQEQPDIWYSDILTVKDSQVFNEKQLEQEKAAIGVPAFEQEYMCSFEVENVGSYFAKEIADLKENNRITDVPYNPGELVHTSWDIGMDDDTVIWFSQKVGHDWHIIDYYRTRNTGMNQIVQDLYAKPYTYGIHLVPHDAANRDRGNAVALKDIMERLGLRNVELLPRTRSLVDDIHATRMFLPTCKFDLKKCEMGIDALHHYQRKFDETRGVFLPTPVHSWASHAADAFRYLVAGKSKIEDTLKPIQKIYNQPKKWIQ